MISHWLLSCSVMITLLVLLIFAPSSHCQEDTAYYSECLSPFNCGNLTALPYPFWAEGLRSELCGLEGYSLRCRENDFPVISIENQKFYVKSVDQPRLEMRIAPLELSESTCPANKNITLNTTLFSSITQDFDSRFPILSLFYNCRNLSDSVSSRQKFSCGEAFYGYDGLRGGWMEETSKCGTTIEVPVQKRFIGEEALTYNLEGVLSSGFSIGYNIKYNESCERCRGSGGICGSNVTNPNPEFSCLCPGRPYPVSCQTPPPPGTFDFFVVYKQIMY